MNDINIPLLRKAVEWVEEQDKLPEIDREWDQVSYVSDPWHRATRMLMEIRTKDQPTLREFNVADQVAAHCGTAYCVAGYVAQLLDENCNPRNIRDIAIAELGLTESQAEDLFAAGNSAANVRRISERIAGQKL